MDRWDKKLGGTILSFANVKLGNNGLGQIQDESPYVHFYTRFEALCFCPEVGSYLSKYFFKE